METNNIVTMSTTHNMRNKKVRRFCTIPQAHFAWNSNFQIQQSQNRIPAVGNNKYTTNKCYINKFSFKIDTAL